VEKRVEGMRKGKADANDAAKAKNTVAATMERPANGLPEDLRDRARLMCDIIAIAYQTNKTRVASLIISRDLSAMYYPFLDVKEGHHSASHNNNSDGYERIARFHVEQYAYPASTNFSLIVTDPVAEKALLAKPNSEYRPKGTYLCTSLGEAHTDGSCYKLVATVISKKPL
jgi:Protein of unknown function (DUF1552)